MWTGSEHSEKYLRLLDSAVEFVTYERVLDALKTGIGE